MAIAIALQFLTERKRPNNINSARCQVRDLCKGHLNAEFANRNGVPVSKKNCSLVGSHSYRKSPLCIRKSSASHQWVNRFGKKNTKFPQWSTLAHSLTQTAFLPEEAGWTVRCPSRCTCNTSAMEYLSAPPPCSSVIKHGLLENPPFSEI